MILDHQCDNCGRCWEAENVPYVGELCDKCQLTFPEFQAFRKIARLSRNIIITEKIDGTNGLIYIDEQNNIFAGSRNRWLWGSIEPEKMENNHGFAAWVKENQEELLKLGKGHHYGEWWGKGIQRGYGLEEKRFSLFNTARWEINSTPACCSVVPILYKGIFDEEKIITCLDALSIMGSQAAPGFRPAEGIVIYHTAAGVYFKKTIENDDKGKEEVK
jgi:hypothetical protein